MKAIVTVIGKDKVGIVAGVSAKLAQLGLREKNMEPIIYEIGIDGESGRDFYSHGTSEEFIYILEGELEVYVANKKYKLSKGDSLYFKSSLKHRFKNTSKKEVKALWVVSPPTF